MRFSKVRPPLNPKGGPRDRMLLHDNEEGSDAIP
jgi:hypothetical protein